MNLIAHNPAVHDDDVRITSDRPPSGYFHAKQPLTYLRLMNLPLGLLINFGGVTLKEGLKRVVNTYRKHKD
jgi:PD-(D/E)XK nuclease superfamily